MMRTTEILDRPAFRGKKAGVRRGFEMISD